MTSIANNPILYTVMSVVSALLLLIAVSSVFRFIFFFVLLGIFAFLFAVGLVLALYAANSSQTCTSVNLVYDELVSKTHQRIQNNSKKWLQFKENSLLKKEASPNTAIFLKPGQLDSAPGSPDTTAHFEIGESGRHQPPPATLQLGPYPSKRVAALMQELSACVVREYIAPLFVLYGWRMDTTEEIRSLVERILRRVVQRLMRIDWVSFSCNTVVRITQQHLNSLRAGASVHEASTMFTNARSESEYAKSVAERILVHVLDVEIYRSQTAKQIIITILANQVLMPTAHYVCTPANVSLWILTYLRGRHKSALKAKRVLYQYTDSYESFYKTINSITNTAELKEIGRKIVSEIRLVEVILLTKKNQKQDSSSSAGGKSMASGEGRPDKGQLLVRRDLSRYRNQLKMCHKKVNRRLYTLMALQGDALFLSDNETTSSFWGAGLEKKLKRRTSGGTFARNSNAKSRHNIVLSFQVIMESEAGRSALKTYLKNTERFGMMIEFIEMVDQMVESPSNAYILGRQALQLYVKSNNPIYHFEKPLIAEMEEFLKGDKSSGAFLKARNIIYRLVEDTWHASFLISTEYANFVRDLGDDVLAPSVYPTSKTFSPNIRDARHRIKQLDQRSSSCGNLLEIGIEPLTNDWPGDDRVTMSTDDELDEDEIGDGEDEELIEEGDDDDELSFGKELDEDDYYGDGDDSSEGARSRKMHVNSGRLDALKGAERDLDSASSDAEGGGDEGVVELAREGKEEGEPVTLCRTMDFFRCRVDELNTRIERKQLALQAMQSAKNDVNCTPKVRDKYTEEMEAVSRDTEKLEESRARLLYQLGRIDRWTEHHGQWCASVYNITLPNFGSPKGDDVGKLSAPQQSSFLSSLKRPSLTLKTKKSDQLLSAPAGPAMALPEVLTVEILVDLPGSEQRLHSHGWIVSHQLAAFYWLRRQLSQISPWINRMSLPSSRGSGLLGRKFTEKHVESITEQLNVFLKSIMCDPRLSQSEQVFRFLCLSAESNPTPLKTGAPSVAIGSSSAPASPARTTLKNRLVEGIKGNLPSRPPVPPPGPGGKVSGFANKLQQLLSGGGGPTSGGISGRSSRAPSSTSLGSMGVWEKSRRGSSASLGVAGANPLLSCLGGGQEQGGHVDEEDMESGGRVKNSRRRRTVLSDAVFDLIEELFQLKDSFDLPRRSLMHLAQVFYGKSLSDVLRENSNWALSEPMIFYYLDSFKSAYFPTADTPTVANQKAAFVASNQQSTSVPSDASNLSASTNGGDKSGAKRDASSGDTPSSRLTVEEAAKRLLWDCLPDVTKTMFGSTNCANGVGFVFEALQNYQANKVLFYKILQAVLEEAFSE